MDSFIHGEITRVSSVLLSLVVAFVPCNIHTGCTACRCHHQKPRDASNLVDHSSGNLSMGEKENTDEIKAQFIRRDDVFHTHPTIYLFFAVPL
ncbi:hypothetical protein BJV74DRAFT_840407 [Russula compacta]|nr:hypothetical protein BJV74DRAFT_840407 [Russula compacta]